MHLARGKKAGSGWHEPGRLHSACIHFDRVTIASLRLLFIFDNLVAVDNPEYK